jgi:enterochelin esterase-like enzyme
MEDDPVTKLARWCARAEGDQDARGPGDRRWAEEVEALATTLLADHGREALSKGVMQVEGTAVLWAALADEHTTLVTRTYARDGEVWAVWEAPHPEPRADILAQGERHSMRRLVDTDVWVWAAELPNFSATAFRFESGNRRFGDSWVVLEHFEPDPECLPQPGVPQGVVTEYGPIESQVFPGTLRGYWLYVPAQYDPEGDLASLMVFQDGGMYLTPQAPVPTVFDNLIAAGEMPVTVGVFVNPGTFPEREGRFQNRMAEYHDRTDAYARFLCEELLPHVEQRVRLRQDAAGRAIAGISSGAVCAFNAAWQRPDAFSKVLSHCGSFTNINGAHNTWAEVRMADRKPLRIWLQDGTNDIDDICGSWTLANRELAAALKFRGYDVHEDWGRGYHSLAHGGATLPAALRWLWRGEVT